LKSLSADEYQGNFQPIRALYAASFGYGARDMAAIVMSRWFRWSVMPLKLSIQKEQTKHAASVVHGVCCPAVSGLNIA
jgi:hypothetical protein